MSTPIQYTCCRGYTQHDPECINNKNKSYADQCLERAEKATEGPWEENWKDILILSSRYDIANFIKELGEEEVE